MNFKIMLFMIYCLFSFTLANENISISGSVRDAESGHVLYGAEIIVQNTSLGASSGFDGKYTISGFKPGKYEITISYLGYNSQSKSIVIEENAENIIDIKLISKPLDIETIFIEADRPFSSASSRSFRKFDMQIRPNSSAQDMLKMAPGLFIAQHAGGGKAEQIFMRGFDADHGTDVAIDVDGVPVNMVSHGHGQGYADLHFLIPEIVENIEVNKGPYFANYGNLATAGAISLKTKDHIEENMIKFESGEFSTNKITTLLQIPQNDEHQNAYIAGQFYRTDGPYQSKQDFQRFNIYGKFHTHLSANSKLLLSLGAFGSAWDASGQIPQRAVNQSYINRFGTIDDFEGGTTGRQNLNLEYTLHDDLSNQFKIQMYASNYNFKLFSNFTFFLEDSINGDMIEQTDNRKILGLNTIYKYSQSIFNWYSSITFGGGFRSDEMTINLWKSPNRNRILNLVNSDINERNFYFWATEEILFNSYFRMQIALRGDYFTFDVEDKNDSPNINIESKLPHASGFDDKAIISPKLNFVFSPLEETDVFLNFGSGFHSNDARDIIISKKIGDLTRLYKKSGLTNQQIADTLNAQNYDPHQKNIETLPRAAGAEIGLCTKISDRVNLGFSFWLLDLEKEFVYVGDAGTTELSDATKRMGIDFETRLKLLSWLWADCDVNISDGRFKNAPNGEDYIPLAPRFTSTGGITIQHSRISGFEGSLRYRYIDNRPANESNTVVAKGYTVFDLSAGYKIGDIQLLFFLENILDSDWNEAQFDTESRLSWEDAPVSEIHFTPGNPRNFRLGIEYKF
jgi:outer membrane receptor protein involved in Fe transport